jgi:hypothetical protein
MSVVACSVIVMESGESAGSHSDGEGLGAGTGAGAGGGIDECLTLIESGLAGLAVASSSAWALSDPESRGVVTRACRLRDELEAKFLHLVRDLDARPDAVKGARPGQVAATFLVHALNLSPARAAADVKAAHAINPGHLGAATAPDGPAAGTASSDSSNPADPAAAESGSPAAPTAGMGPGGAAGGLGAGGVRRLPLLGAALAAGQVSREHLDVGVRVLRKIPTHRLTRVGTDGVTGAGKVDAWLTQVSRTLPPSSRKHAARHLLNVIDPDNADRYDPAALQRRELFIAVDSTGMVIMRGQLDPVSGAKVRRALEYFSTPNPMRREPAYGDGQAGGADEGEGVGGQQMLPIRDNRTAPQRRADGLANICDLAMSTISSRSHADDIRGATGDADRNLSWLTIMGILWWRGCDVRVRRLRGWDLDTNPGTARLVGLVGVPVRSHGEDGVGRDRGADRVLQPAWLTGDRAHWLRA